MADASPALKYLGTMLRELRERRKINTTEMGVLMGLSQSTISKLENGKAGLPTKERLVRYVEAVGADGLDVGRVMRQWELAQLDPASFDALRAGGLDNKQRQLASLERTSRSIREFQCAVVPGLLQTPQYALQVFASLGLDVEHARRAVVARTRRQPILNDPHRSFRFVLAEPVLYSFHGMPSTVLREQLAMLAARMSSPNVTIRILVTENGWPLETASPFCIIDRRYVSEESTTREVVATDASEITRYEEAFANIWNSALDPQASAARARARVAELEG